MKTKIYINNYTDMLKRFTLLFMVSLVTNAGYISAQPVLQPVSIPVSGDLWSNKTITDTTIQPGPGGSGQIWNFSNFFVNPSVISEAYSTPTGTGNDALFPTANLKSTSIFGGDDYYLRTGNELQYLGSKSSTMEIIISNAQKIMSVPFAYGDSIVNPAVTGMGPSGYSLSGTISVKADGAGDLTLYTGSFTNSLRVVTNVNLIIGAGTGLDTYLNITRHTWYSALYRAPVFQISVLDINGSLSNVHQKVVTVSTLTTGVEQLSATPLDFSIFPNPAAGSTQLSVNSLHASVENIQITDLTGRLCKVQKVSLQPGLNKFPLDIADLPKGVYSVGTDAPNSVATRLVID
jgi:hypothetical protein